MSKLTTDHIAQIGRRCAIILFHSGSRTPSSGSSSDGVSTLSPAQRMNGIRTICTGQAIRRMMTLCSALAVSKAAATRTSFQASVPKNSIPRIGFASSNRQERSMSFRLPSTTTDSQCTTQTSPIGPWSRWGRIAMFWRNCRQPFAERDCTLGSPRIAPNTTTTTERAVRSVQMSMIRNMRPFMARPTSGSTIRILTR